MPDGGIRVSEGWELMRIKGIPLKVHPSWFLILLLFTWTSQGQVSRVIEAPIPPWISWGMGLITALLLFLSVLLHELGHSFVALNEGVKVRSITLFLLGGVATVDRECSTPMGALRVAIAGPLVSLFLAMALFWGVNSTRDVSPLLVNLFAQLGSLNLVLGFFNLLPGLPLDGGLILKALVWQCTGSQRRGIEVATATGRILSFTAIVLGVWICFRTAGLGGLWLVILGWFGLAASRSQSQMLALQQLLCEITISGNAGRRFRVLEDDQSLRRLSELKLASSEGQPLPDWVLVCHSGRWVGYITEKPLKELTVQQWDHQLLSDHLRPISELPAISEKSPLWEAVLAIENSAEGRLLVFNLAGLPSGTFDRIDLGTAVLKGLGLKLPPQLLEAARSQNTYPLGMNLSRVVEDMISAGVVKPSKD